MAGRWIEVEYETLAFTDAETLAIGHDATVTAAADGWIELTWPTPRGAARFFRYYNPFDQAAIAGLEFHGANGQILNGTIISSGPGVTPEQGPAAAFDGDPDTHFFYEHRQHGWVGIDFGPDTTAELSKIRYRTGPGYENTVSTWMFESMNVRPTQDVVLKRVFASDGREVVYDYDYIPDEITGGQTLVLTGALYGDGAQATYTYQRLHPATEPAPPSPPPSPTPTAASPPSLTMSSGACSARPATPAPPTPPPPPAPTISPGTSSPSPTPSAAPAP